MPASHPTLSALAQATYVSLRTFRRDGSGVDTPVWIAGLDGSLVAFTDGMSLKVKRVCANPHCAVATCNAVGTVSSEWIQGSAGVITDPERERRAFEALRAKYGNLVRIAKVSRFGVEEALEGKGALFSRRDARIRT